jgi:hypothetical protein
MCPKMLAIMVMEQPRWGCSESSRKLLQMHNRQGGCMAVSSRDIYEKASTTSH